MSVAPTWQTPREKGPGPEIPVNWHQTVLKSLDWGSGKHPGRAVGQVRGQYRTGGISGFLDYVPELSRGHRDLEVTGILKENKILALKYNRVSQDCQQGLPARINLIVLWSDCPPSPELQQILFSGIK